MIFAFAHHSTLETPPAHQTTDWSRIAHKSTLLVQRLSDLHRYGYSHHDLHPGDVMYVHQGTPVLIDVGIARSFDASHSTGVYGRIEYFPPELFIHETQTSASDAYCFATLLWQLSRGCHHEISRPSPSRGTQILRESMIPDAPAEFEAVLRKCWHEDPTQRPYVWQIYHQLA